MLISFYTCLCVGEAKVIFLTFLNPDDYWKHIQSLYFSLSSIDFPACLEVRGAERNEYKQHSSPKQCDMN